MLPAFLTAKAVAVTALICGLLFNLDPLQSWNYHAFSAKAAGAWLAFINWDGQHYLRLAINGYPVPPDPSTTFFPLFPALIALVMALGFGPIAAGLIVATLLSALAMVMFTKLLAADASPPSSLWLLASFPTAFYLSVVYTEGLFIAALLGLFWALRDRRRTPWTILFAFLLPVARGQGLWMIVPIALGWIFAGWRSSGPHACDRRALEHAGLGYALGLLAYCLVFGWVYGDPLAGLAEQDAFVFQNTLSNLFDVRRFLGFLVKPPEHFFAFMNSGLDKAMLAVSLTAFAFGARRCPDAFTLSSWLCLALLPAMMGEGTSYARHALLAWTCFALFAGPTLKPAIKWFLIVAGFALQIYLAFRFGGNRWVG